MFINFIELSIEKTEEIVEINSPLSLADIAAIKELGIKKVYLKTAEEEIDEEKIPVAIFELLLEEFPEPEIAEEPEESPDDEKESKVKEQDDEDEVPLTLEEKLEAINEQIDELKRNMLKGFAVIVDRNRRHESFKIHKV